MSIKLAFVGSLLIACFSGWWAFQVFQDYRALRSNPGRAKGSVVRKSSHTDQQSHTTTLSVSYKFEVNAESYQDTIQVGASDYANFSEGGQVNVLYVVDDPTRSCLAGHEPSKTMLIFLASFASIWILVSGFAGRQILKTS